MNQGQLFDAGRIHIGSRRRSPGIAGKCREPGCDNRARAVQGARYCHEHSRSNGYNPLSGTEPGTCRLCGADYRRHHRSTQRSEAARAWHDYCNDCRVASPLNLKRMVHHNVPYETATEWLSKGSNLRCQVCDRVLHRKSQQSAPCIDHDHKCCDLPRSCGHCIRGILCVRCNTIIGAYESLLTNIGAEKVHSYLAF